MRDVCFSVFAVLFSVMLAFPAFAHEWRTFESPEGDKSFTARVVAVDPVARTVTVIMRDGNRRLTFSLDRLKPEDQEYARHQAQKAVVKSSFRVNFGREMKQKGKTVKGDVTTTTYDGFFQIKVENYAPQTVRDVTVEYLLIWRQDSFEGMGPEQVVRGSQKIDNIFANGTHQVTTKIVDMKAVYQKGRVETDNSNRGQTGPDGNPLGPSTMSYKSQRSRDQLVGCVVQIRVGDHVVLAEASSPMLNKYLDAFLLLEETPEKDGADKDGKDGDGK